MNDLMTVLIGGSDKTKYVRFTETEIVDQLNEVPNTAALVVRNITPAYGQTVEIWCNSLALFKGLVAGYDVLQKTASQRARYQLNCTDWTYLLDRQLVNEQFTSWMANSIAAALVNSFTTGFTITNVQNSLTTVDLPCKMESVSQALTRLANLAGGFWYVDYDKDVHFRTSESLTQPASLTLTTGSFRELRYTKTGQQIRTRVFVEGAGAVVSQPAGIGATTLWVDALANFSVSGGTLITDDAQILTYTGRASAYGASTVVARPKPAAWTATRVASGAGTPDETGVWDVKLLFVYGDGSKSLPTQSSATVTITGPNDGITIPLEIGPSNVTERWWYLKKPSSGNFVGETTFQKMANNSSTTTSVGAQLNGATTQPPTSDANYAAGVTYIYVTDTSKFNGSGGTVAYGTAKTFTYTGRSTSSGIGALTGIPSAGAGSISATITIGDTLTYQPSAADYYLSGIPATGAGSIVRDIGKGANVELLTQRDDTTAQNTIGSLLASSGIFHHYIQDRRLSLSGAQARGDAELTLGKDLDEALTYISQDEAAFSGRTIGVNVSGIVTTLKIQQVRINWDRDFRLPQRTVIATNRFKSYYEYVRDLQNKIERTV